MNVNFYVTCIADVVKSGVAKNTVITTRKARLYVIFLENKAVAGQPALNQRLHQTSHSRHEKLSRNLWSERLSYRCPCRFLCLCYQNYPEYFTKVGELDWAERAKKVVARFCDLTDFIVNKLGVTDVGAYLPGKAVYHPSCSLTRKLGIVDEPIALLKA